MKGVQTHMKQIITILTLLSVVFGFQACAEIPPIPFGKTTYADQRIAEQARLKVVALELGEAAKATTSTQSKERLLSQAKENAQIAASMERQDRATANAVALKQMLAKRERQCRECKRPVPTQL